MAMSLLASCSMDTESKTDLNSETAYATQESAAIALVGCYDGWQRTSSDAGVGMYLTAEFASEQAFAGLGAGDEKNNNVIDQFDKAVAPSYNDLFNTDWKNYYAAIFRCNQLIQAAGKYAWGETESGRQLVGEARGIRAILYFDLARLFGDVPLVLEPTDANLPRTTASEVYKAIFEDFKYAIENIPAGAYPVSDNSTTDGRMTKYAAEAMMARAYLYYTGYYGETEAPGCTKQNAIDALQDIINNGGYQLEASYADLFMPSCTTDGTTGSGDNAVYGWNTTYAGKWYDGSKWQSGQGKLSKEFVLNLKFNTTHDYSGNGDGNTFSVYLGPRNKSATSVCIASGWGGCSVTPQFVSEYQNDPRFKACVWSCSDAGFSADLADTYEYTGYYTRKYAPMCFKDGMRQEEGFNLGKKHQNITYYQDWTIMRYADVLLMQAELTKNVTYLNLVRTRAGLSALGAVTDEALRYERGIEFAFEGVHYWDIMRYEKEGAYAATKITEAQSGADVQNGGVAAKTNFAKDNFSSKKGLMQIPNTQITLSGNTITQNAGW